MIDQVGPMWKEFGPCYWGHNDVDRFNPWQNEDLFMEELKRKS